MTRRAKYRSCNMITIALIRPAFCSPRKTIDAFYLQTKINNTKSTSVDWFSNTKGSCEESKTNKRLDISKGPTVAMITEVNIYCVNTTTIIPRAKSTEYIYLSYDSWRFKWYPSPTKSMRCRSIVISITYLNHICEIQQRLFNENIF